MENTQISDNLVPKTPLHDENGKFAVGHEKIGGRIVGKRNFDTLFDLAVKRIVEELKIPVKDPENELVVKAVVEGLKGKYAFYKDIMDRRHGEAKKPFDIHQTGEVKTNLGPEAIAEIAKRVSEEIKKSYDEE